MARFDLHRDVSGRLVVNVQSALLPEMGSRLVVPLMPPDAIPRPMKRLHPRVTIDGVEFVFATHLMAAVRVRDLGRPLQSLDEHYDRLVSAVDFVFNGF
ncbi:MAG: CcdB family protein [Devosia sp.]